MASQHLEAINSTGRKRTSGWRAKFPHVLVAHQRLLRICPTSTGRPGRWSCFGKASFAAIPGVVLVALSVATAAAFVGGYLAALGRDDRERSFCLHTLAVFTSGVSGRTATGRPALHQLTLAAYWATYYDWQASPMCPEWENSAHPSVRNNFFESQRIFGITRGPFGGAGAGKSAHLRVRRRD